MSALTNHEMWTALTAFSVGGLVTTYFMGPAPWVVFSVFTAIFLVMQLATMESTRGFARKWTASEA